MAQIFIPRGVGVHTKWKKNFKDSLQGLDLSLPYQVMFSRYMYTLPSLIQEDVDWASQNSHCFIHAPYTINIARNHENFELMTSCLTQTMQVAERLNSGCVFHSGVGSPEGLAFVLNQLPLTNHGRGASLLIENAAEKTKVAFSMDGIRRVTEAAEFSRGIGWCLDTQHAFGAGLTNWDTDGWVELIEQMREWKLGLVHLNDSKVEYNTGKDRHALIGTGFIWSGKINNLIRLTDILNDIGVPMVIE